MDRPFSQERRNSRGFSFLFLSFCLLFALSSTNKQIDCKLKRPNGLREGGSDCEAEDRSSASCSLFPTGRQIEVINVCFALRNNRLSRRSDGPGSPVHLLFSSCSPLILQPVSVLHPFLLSAPCSPLPYLSLVSIIFLLRFVFLFDWVPSRSFPFLHREAPPRGSCSSSLSPPRSPALNVSTSSLLLLPAPPFSSRPALPSEFHHLQAPLTSIADAPCPQPTPP